METNVITHNLNETLELGKKIAPYLFKGSVITLKGDLGAGKTSFTKGVGFGLGIKEEIISPTFNILKCYFHKPINMYHIDAYRLEDVPSENKNIGLDEIIEGDGITLIEWDEFIKEYIDYNESLNIKITINKDNTRNFEISSVNKRYEPLFKELNNND
ncbi:MAG: tRNA (adenosine(37)-N6)-threonylcarbamoyltransferase complex ATPase subunit type 1 TsaE [Firmicutes bacterium]|uniref:tRNA threonylcarbamoyladenosine biosynthesis protein TsaE n=1 Tax=Candidatus Onthovivens merdipullorum TaxID=2840889 RepID=A0A9D9DIK9_9BACL|nr:tRNA (adenosine(37)-N6)-threonylcarbamoyltransferase complex ATPase subunit type 1 TsaE [Candidatus Onthovivens merdipullorum]